MGWCWPIGLAPRLRELDSFQFHPTGIAWPPHLAGTLISEAARAAGGTLLNGHGARFVDELPRATSFAAAILREIAEGRAVARDGTTGRAAGHASAGACRAGYPAREASSLCRTWRTAAASTRREEPFLVRPTLHYQNGGIAIDTDGRTCIPGLFCAGEVSGGLHGRNRLMGNALLELVAFGRRAGTMAAAEARREPEGAVGVGHLAAWERGLAAAGLPLDQRAPMIFPPYGNVDIRAALRRELVA